MSEKDVTDELIGFVLPDTTHQCFAEFVQFLMLIYCQMRGKDFSMKLLKKNSSLKIPVRQIQAVLSDPKHRVKKENTLSPAEQLMNDEFARIVREMEMAEENDE